MHQEWYFPSDFIKHFLSGFRETEEEEEEFQGNICQQKREERISFEVITIADTYHSYVVHYKHNFSSLRGQIY